MSLLHKTVALGSHEVTFYYYRLKVCAFANRAVRLGGLTTATFTTAGVVEEGKLQRVHKGGRDGLSTSRRR